MIPKLEEFLTIPTHSYAPNLLGGGVWLWGVGLKLRRNFRGRPPTLVRFLQCGWGSSEHVT